jgi:hypothetical protein
LLFNYESIINGVNVLKDKLSIDATFRLEGGWSVETPRSYEVELSEPLAKSGSGLMSFMGVESLSIIVALQHAGIFEWAANTAYDELWDYLKQMSKKLPWSPHERKCSLKVHGLDDGLRLAVDIDSFEVATLQKGEFKVKNEIIKFSNGDVKEISSITIKIRND